MEPNIERFVSSKEKSLIKKSAMHYKIPFQENLCSQRERKKKQTEGLNHFSCALQLGKELNILNVK